MVTIDASLVVPLETLRLQCLVDDDLQDSLLQQYAQAALDYCLAVCDDPSINAPELVPQRVKQAVLLLVGHWFNAREAVVMGTSVAEVPLGVQALLWTCRNLYGGPLPVTEA